MKKTILKRIPIIFALFGFAYIFSQGKVTIGKNTTPPYTTLDVKGDPTNTASPDGLQAPRLTRAELTSKTATYGDGTPSQKGALIYITDVSGGDVLGSRVNIDAEGYYSFDGAIWQKVATTSIYTDPWNKAGTTTPSDSNTDNIYQMGKVGINTTTPAAKIHIKGSGGITEDPLQLDALQEIPSTKLAASPVVADSKYDNLLAFDSNGVAKSLDVTSNIVSLNVIGTSDTDWVAGTNFTDGVEKTLLLSSATLNSGDTTKYSTTTGEYTVEQDGMYYIKAHTVLRLKDGINLKQGSGLFDGKTGLFATRIYADTNILNEKFALVFKGAKTVATNNDELQDCNATMYLKAGQKVKVTIQVSQFSNLADLNSDILIIRSLSSLTVTKMF